MSHTTATSQQYWIRLNGDDADVIDRFDTYKEATDAAIANSSHWLGTALYGPSGKIGTYLDGVETGYRLSSGAWVTR